jgi:hypothetical protein
MSLYTSIAILSMLLGVTACSSHGPTSERPSLPNTSKGYTVQSRGSRASSTTADAILRCLNEHKEEFSHSPRDCRVPISGPMLELAPSRYVRFEHPFKPDMAVALFDVTTRLQILQISEQQGGQSRFYVSRDRRLIDEFVRILDAGYEAPGEGGRGDGDKPPN